MTFTEKNTFDSCACLALSCGVSTNKKHHLFTSKLNNYKVSENISNSICYGVNQFQKVNRENKGGYRGGRGSLEMK